MNAGQERFYVGLDGSFDWKHPSLAKKGDKDCTDMPPRMFQLFMERVGRKFCKPAEALNLASQD